MLALSNGKELGVCNPELLLNAKSVIPAGRDAQSKGESFREPA